MKQHNGQKIGLVGQKVSKSNLELSGTDGLDRNSGRDRPLKLSCPSVTRH